MVYLIGAGPGNPGLITVKGMELLKKCDALIYDRLGTNELLELVATNCKKIYVGKRPGAHYRSQDEINDILIETAKKYKTVVRLKGGDPFVFGRGGEEVIALKSNKIPFQVIPGVTSAIAVPELQGIPVTHREVSRSFHVYTGHTRSGDDDSLSYIHKSEGSSVFLMGISHIEGIAQKLLDDGCEASMPVSVISQGTLPGEKKIIGTLSDIVQKVHDNNISSPAIIIVGETANYSYISGDISVLQGKKFGVVGTRQLRERMRISLEELGASLFSICSMEIMPISSCDISQGKLVYDIENELKHIGEYNWIVFTSGNSIKLFFDRVKKMHIDFRSFAKVRFAVVGSGTLDKLREYGFEADYCPGHYTTKALAQGLTEQLDKNDKLLIPRALRGSNEMLEVLDTANISYTVIPIYDVVGTRTDNWQYIDDFDVLVFASGSGVEAFIGELKKDIDTSSVGEECSNKLDISSIGEACSGKADVSSWDEKRKKNGTKIAAIGDMTASVLRKYDITADIVPKQCDIEGLIQAVREYYETTDD